MKTTIEKFMDDFQGDGKVFKFSTEIREYWRKLAIEEIREAWEDGYFAGIMDDTNDPEQYIKEKYPESFGNVKERE